MKEVIVNCNELADFVRNILQGLLHLTLKPKLIEIDDSTSKKIKTIVELR
jgi:hypothetical protein